MSAEQPRALPTFVAAAAVVLLWGSAFVAVDLALRELPPGPLALARYAVASLAFVALVLFRGTSVPSRRDLLRLVVAGATGIALYNLSLNAGQLTVSPGVASLLVNTVPIWTALLAFTVLGERMDRRGWVGTALSFAGVSAIGLHKGGWAGFDVGVLLVVGAAISQAVYFVITKPLLERHHPIDVTAWAVWFGTLCLLPFGGQTWSLLTMSSTETLLAVLFLGVGPAALAYAAWSYVLAELPAAQAANILFLIPVVAIGIAWTVLLELPSTVALLGGALSVLGVLVGRGLVFGSWSLRGRR